MMRIFIVDDDEMLLELFRELLTDEGYEVISSITPPYSSDEIEQMQPDLIIVDYSCVARWGEPVSLAWLPDGSH
ncbi:MAG: response regulator, partial [Ardenticatenales bacterium]|nr:response regulator [Ardenticatenales bacterium]